MADVETQIERLTEDLVTSESEHQIAQIERKLRILRALKA